MGKARVCVIEQYGEVRCTGHRHISQDEASAGVASGRFEWITEPKSSTKRGMVLVRRQPHIYDRKHIEARGNDANAKSRSVFLTRGTKF